MKIFTYHTQRTIEVVAETEQEADQLVQAELHHDETILSMDEEEEVEPDPIYSGVSGD